MGIRGLNSQVLAARNDDEFVMVTLTVIVTLTVMALSLMEAVALRLMEAICPYK